MNNSDIYSKFPAIFRDKLLSGEIQFPEDTMFEYKPVLVYRAVERTADDNTPVSRKDFMSYAELNKKPPRGKSYDTSSPNYYGVSSFLRKEIVEQNMHFPNPNKKMAIGYIYQEGGPQQTKLEKQHVCWWLYDDVDLSGFELSE